MADWLRVPGEGAYARRERERRFLLEGAAPQGFSYRSIEDRYLDGTRLRLRVVSAGDDVVRKLGQKVRLRPDDPSEVAMTNAYLSEDEHRVLAALPAAVLTKTRCAVPVDGRTWVVDRFCGHLQGLRLAEVEVPDLDAPLVLPSWAGREVTREERWSGGALARAGTAQVAALLAESAGVVVSLDDPAADDVRALLERHLGFAHAHSPPQDVHALPADALRAADVALFGARADGVLLAVGALRHLDDGHVELKSMHTAAQARGRGVARAVLAHLLEVARARGCRRVSLETGSTEAFAPARALYDSAGFRPCPPFGSYPGGPFSTCMTLELG